MRILVLSTLDDRSGDCPWLARHIARALAGAGHEVTLVAPRGKDSDSEPAERLRVVNYATGPRFFRSWRALLAALPHVLHAHLVVACTPALDLTIPWLLRHLFYRPYAAVVVRDEFQRFRRKRLRAAWLRRLYRGATAVIALSGSSRKGLVAFGVAPAHIATVPPGRLYPDAPEAPAEPHPDLLHAQHIVLSVAPFLPNGGQLTLINALPQILASAPGTVLVLPGNGPLLHRCVRRARELEVRDGVLFPGPLDDRQLYALFEVCDLFALPIAPDGALEHGAGLMLPEALAHGKPVVTAAMSGYDEFVQHEKTGLCVNVTTPTAMAEAVVRLLNDPETAAAMGRQGVQQVRNVYNWPRFAQTLVVAVEERR